MSIQVDSYIKSLANTVSSMTGLNSNVVLAQWNAEEGVSNPSSWISNNPAGITHGNSAVDAYSIGVNKSGFDIFPNIQSGAMAYATLINTDPSYSGIRASAKSGDVFSQLSAIASSPWDAGHYGGDGSSLFNSYSSITGATVVNNGTTGSTANSTSGGSTTSSTNSTGGGAVDTILNSIKFDGIYFILFLLLLFGLYITFGK